MQRRYGPEVCNAFELFGYPVYIGYGLTETSPVCLVHNDRYRRPDDVGYPIAGLRAKIVDSDEDGVGELAVKGPNVMLGYYHDPQATAQVMHDGWFYTGDLAKEKTKWRVPNLRKNQKYDRAQKRKKGFSRRIGAVFGTGTMRGGMYGVRRGRKRYLRVDSGCLSQ